MRDIFDFIAENYDKQIKSEKHENQTSHFQDQERKIYTIYLFKFIQK